MNSWKITKSRITASLFWQQPRFPGLHAKMKEMNVGADKSEKKDAHISSSLKGVKCLAVTLSTVNTIKIQENTRF